MTKPNTQRYQRDFFSSRRVLGVILALLVAWCAILVVGSLMQPRSSFTRLVIIMATMLTFVGLWIVALKTRRR